jgi:hypothetical protein
MRANNEGSEFPANLDASRYDEPRNSMTSCVSETCVPYF